jgi:hypothetical protein
MTILTKENAGKYCLIHSSSIYDLCKSCSALPVILIAQDTDVPLAIRDLNGFFSIHEISYIQDNSDNSGHDKRGNIMVKGHCLTFG